MRRLLAIAATLGVVTAALVPVTGAEAAADPTQRVLLALTPQDAGALKALAARSGGGKAPARALAAALPSPQRRSDVARIARGLGLSVRQAGTMAVVVEGRASRVKTLFGSAKQARPRSAVAAPLPSLPSALRGLVTVALGGDDDRPAFRHFAGATGSALRSEYGPARTVTTNPSAATQTVATVQLSDWNDSDLTNYVDDLQAAPGGSAFPNESYTGIYDEDFPAELGDFGDDIEVSLDQEALYAVAPYVRQRAYLVENSGGGFFTALARIGDDAGDPLVDNHIVAASISWGLCEGSDLSVGNASDASFVDAMENVLSYVVSSGVTVFAATGDHGQNCRSYPATSPLVVAVGGTEHADDALTSAPATWDDPAAGPDPAIGSGGGTSTFFPRPAYQAGLAGGLGSGRSIPDLSALGGNPGFDVFSSSPSLPGPGYLTGVMGTSLASPVAAGTFAAGLDAVGYSWGIGNILPSLYSATAVAGTNPAWTDVTTGTTNAAKPTGVGYDQGSGLGTPKWDTLLPTLGGDPHLTVTYFQTTPKTVAVTVRKASFQTFTSYRIARADFFFPACTTGSPTPPTTFDLTEGDPTYEAGDGTYDGQTQLALIAIDAAGTCHYAFATVFVDETLPTVKALSLSRNSQTLKMTATATFGDEEPSSGVRQYRFQVFEYPPGSTSRGQLLDVVQTSRTLKDFATAKAGYAYLVRAYAQDMAKNWSVKRDTAKLDTPYDDRTFTFTGSWGAPGTSSSDFRGTYRASSAAGAKALSRRTGRVYALLMRIGPSYGKAQVYVGSALVRTIDLYSPTVRYQVAFGAFTSSTTAARTVQVRVLGQRNPKSRGSTVVVDGLRVGT